MVIERSHHRSEAGSSAVEYGLLIALIAAVITAAVIVLGGTVLDLFDDTCQTATEHGALQDDC